MCGIQINCQAIPLYHLKQREEDYDKKTTLLLQSKTELDFCATCSRNHILKLIVLGLGGKQADASNDMLAKAVNNYLCVTTIDSNEATQS